MPAQKTTLSRVVLLCAAAATVALVLGAVSVRRQMHTLIEDAHMTRFAESGAVAVSNLAGVAEQYLADPNRHQVELAALADTVRSLSDARGVTLTGARSAGRPNSFGYVWASSEERFRAADGSRNFTAGETVLTDELSPELGRLRAAVNAEGEQELAELSGQIRQVSTQILELLTQGDADREADREAEIAELDAIFRVLYERATALLAAVGEQHSGSIPAAPSLHDNEVLFYHPVVVFDQSTAGWYVGMVRLRRLLAATRAAVSAEQHAADTTGLRRGAFLLAALWGFFLVLSVVVRRL
ncbi:MAG: hypothetical protein LC641_04260 [Spirochaeta sp.]|nr:hypothetical protein [Spirochaeta sp.]